MTWQIRQPEPGLSFFAMRGSRALKNFAVSTGRSGQSRFLAILWNLNCLWRYLSEAWRATTPAGARAAAFGEGGPKLCGPSQLL